MATATATRRRYGWIDVLKGAGIVTVVWIHAFMRLADPMPEVVERLGFLARFAVPGFFLAAGFLQAISPRLGWHDLCSRRLVRLVAPYLVASIAAIALRVAVGDHRGSLGGMLRDLIGGGGWGIFYFVPMLVAASALGEWVFRRPRLAWPLWALFAVLGLLNELQYISFHNLWWEFRSPLRWWGYFLAGWVVALHRERIDALPDSLRRAAGLAALLVAAAGFTTYATRLPTGWSRPAVALQYVVMYASVLGTVLLAWKATPPGWIRWLSEASYPIYLYHFFPIFLMHRFPGGPGRDILAFVVALAVCVCGVLAARRLLNERARFVFG